MQPNWCGRDAWRPVMMRRLQKSIAALLADQAQDLVFRTGVLAATSLLSVTAMGLSVAAGVTWLAHRIGFPGAALAVAALIMILAVALNFVGQRMAEKKARRHAVERQAMLADPAMAIALSVPPLRSLQLAAFLVGVVLARRV